MSKNKKDNSIVRSELKVEILKTISNFKSKENPGFKLKNKDVINALSQILARKTE